MYLETDAHVSRDGVLVAFHDGRLDRVTDRMGAIAELAIAEVEAADAGYAFSLDRGGSFPFRGRGIRVPRLEEVLVRWPAARVNIDPKADTCVGPLAALLDRLGAWERVCVGSFSDRRLRLIRAHGRGRACTSMGPGAVALARLAATSGRMPRSGANCVQVPIQRGPVRIVSKRFVEAAHRAGLAVHIWTINDEETINELLDLGANGDSRGGARTVTAGAASWLICSSTPSRPAPLRDTPSPGSRGRRGGIAQHDRSSPNMAIVARATPGTGSGGTTSAWTASATPPADQRIEQTRSPVR